MAPIIWAMLHRRKIVTTPITNLKVPPRIKFNKVAYRCEELVQFVN